MISKISLEQFLLTVGQNNFGNKIPFIKLAFFQSTIWWGLVQKNLLSLHPTKPRCHFPWGKQFIVVFTPCPATESVHIFYPSGCTMSQFGEIISDGEFLQFIYHKVAGSNTSRLEAHTGFFRLLMKGIFDSYVL